MQSIKRRLRTFITSVVLVLASAGTGVAAAPPAAAWVTSSNVNVIFNVSNCAGASGLWGWYNTSEGEYGWVQWHYGYQGSFNLHHVPYSGAVTTIKWGRPGVQCGVHYLNLRRPGWGTTVALGWIG
jgi:hypothetical protein